jgi:hypothetical protein
MSPSFREGNQFSSHIYGQPTVDFYAQKERLQRNKSDKMYTNHYYINIMKNSLSEYRISESHRGCAFQTKLQQGPETRDGSFSMVNPHFSEGVKLAD